MIWITKITGGLRPKVPKGMKIDAQGGKKSFPPWILINSEWHYIFTNLDVFKKMYIQAQTLMKHFEIRGLAIVLIRRTPAGFFFSSSGFFFAGFENNLSSLALASVCEEVERGVIGEEPDLPEGNPIPFKPTHAWLGRYLLVWQRNWWLGNFPVGLCRLVTPFGWRGVTGGTLFGRKIFFSREGRVHYLGGLHFWGDALLVGIFLFPPKYVFARFVRTLTPKIRLRFRSPRV